MLLGLGLLAAWLFSIGGCVMVFTRLDLTADSSQLGSFLYYNAQVLIVVFVAFLIVLITLSFTVLVVKEFLCTKTSTQFPISSNVTVSIWKAIGLLPVRLLVSLSLAIILACAGIITVR